MENEEKFIKHQNLSKSDKEVTVVDVNIPFWSMVRLLVTLSIAAIPAFLFLAAFYMAAIYLISLFK